MARPRRQRRSTVRAFARLIAGVAVLGVFAILIANGIVLAYAAIAWPSTAPNVPPVGMVFGAGLSDDGGPSAMLADRLDGGIALYKSGRVKSLLFTGDNGTVEHNELRPMLLYALRRGVPRSAITLDYAGFNTYDSCYRAVHIFHVRHAILVTQSFHLPRAMFLCRALGMQHVEGSARPDWGVYDARLMFDEGVVRETLARAKAVWQATVTRPVPAVL